jgi:succinate dehydrogenase / fumarate reductase, membrane anchor subunit
MAMRTPLKNVRGLGSAKEGADHFWKQRVTAVVNLVLSLFVVSLAVGLAGEGHAAVVAALKNPLVAVALILFVTSAAIHMRIGMQVIIEDYIHGEGAKIALLMLNTFFSVSVAAASIFSILKLSFGG